MSKKIEIYSTPTCTYCAMAKDFLNEKGIAFDEYNVAADLEKRKEMIEKSGQMGVPVIVIDGKITVGFNKEQLASELGIEA